MGDTPLEKIRYILYKWSQDMDFNDKVTEDVVIKRAQGLVKTLGKSDYQYHAEELEKLLEEYAIEQVLLNPSV